MKLWDICMKIAHIENGLADGEISFSYGKFACAMKPGHPADILDDIFCPVGNAVCLEQEVTKKDIEDLAVNLEAFGRSFSVDVEEPVNDLRIYIQENYE